MYPDPFAPENLSLDRNGTITEAKVELPSIRKRRDRHFLPALPERLFDRLIALPGKCLGVYLLILQRSRMENRNPVVLTSTRLDRCGLSRMQKRRALATLENAGLISVERRTRINPLVTLLQEEQAVNPAKRGGGLVTA
jgi:hypothetical protein